MAAPEGQPQPFRFGSFELELDERRLLKDGIAVSLRPRAFDLLTALVDRAGHLVTKDELLDRVWPKVVVEETALRVQLSALRKVLGADAVATVSGQGYRFTLPVTKREAQPQGISTSQHNLPYQVTSFVGREQEIAQLRELVTTNRLVTLTGAGGVGKTRLAIEVASRLVDAFADGVWLVQLAALSDPHLVSNAVARALQVKEQPARPVIETLGDYLASKKLLLVLDNAEHMLEGCMQFMDLVLQRSPGVAILVTSRERIGIAGELTSRVPSLTVPGTNATLTPGTMSPYEGVRLFVERAKLVRPDFEVTTENSFSVASICTRLDGMPLAIELAAPRLRSMSLDELSQRLDQRFEVLTDGSRMALPRHRTLRSTIDWSYDLLTQREQAILRRVAVFAGGWTLASAGKTCAGDGIDASSVMELLTSLVDKSLVVTEEEAGVTRYRMLETVRQYTLDRLRDSSEEAQWRGSHLACFVALAEEFFEGVKGPEQESWFSRIASEHCNVRVALAWSAESSPTEGLRLARALSAFWRHRVHLSEGREWLVRLLDAVPIDGLTRERAGGLFVAAMLAMAQGDYAAPARLLQESLALYCETDDPNGVSRALQGLAHLSILQARYPEGEALAREVIDRVRVTGDRGQLCTNLGILANALHAQGRWGEAREAFEQALEVARELGTPIEMGHTLSDIGRAECDAGRHDLALKYLGEGMTILHGLGDRPGVIEALEGFAGLAAATGAPQRAARLWGAADALREEIGNAISVHDRIAFERQSKAVRETLPGQAFDQAWDEGQAMTPDDAVRYALDEQAEPDSRSPE